MRWGTALLWMWPIWLAHQQAGFPPLVTPEAKVAAAETAAAAPWTGPRSLGLADTVPGPDIRVNQDLSTRAQNEPAIAVDPNDPQHLVAAWNDNTDYDPATQWQVTRIAYGWSRDGGATWQSRVPSFPNIYEYNPSADPSVAIGSDGVVYFGFLPYDQFDVGDGRRRVVVARSTDGGETFANPVTVDTGYVDKPWMTVDPASGALFVAYRYDTTTGDTGIRLKKSTDGGVTFGAAIDIAQEKTAEATGPMPVVGRNGRVYIAWCNRVDKIWFDKSLDGGATWLANDIVVSSFVSPRNPIAGGFKNPAFAFTALDRSAGPYDGRIYVAWPDQRYGDPDILLSRSSDEGATWSAPMRVNDDAIGNDADQFFPFVTVDGGGRVHVVFLDRRDDPAGMRVAAYVATSSDGGATFGPNIRISDDAYAPGGFKFFGDYVGAAAAGITLFAVFTDARDGDQDIRLSRVSTIDFDGDGVLNDGDGSGVYGDHPCTGGATTGCDDNCPGTPNANQTDADSDGVGDACDDCPATPNRTQADVDRDGIGDACDACNGRAGSFPGDADGDGVAGCVDICPDVPDPGQADSDGDGSGDACDPCPLSAADDRDGDGRCGDADNCPTVFNPAQADGDGDGVGDACDVCPGASDAAQTDTDGDGAGDACDCQATDGGDRTPGVVSNLRMLGRGASTHWAWQRMAGGDAFSVSRGSVSQLPSGDYGSCLVQGISENGFDDPSAPPAGQAWFYLVQAQSFECGLGSPGTNSQGQARVNGNPSACTGASRSDVRATSEQTIYGTKSGTFAALSASDDVREALTEELTTVIPRYTRLEHRWTLSAPAGSRKEFHAEGFQTSSMDGDQFVFEYSTDGGATWQRIQQFFPLPAIDEGNAEHVAPLPNNLVGSVMIRVIDTQRVGNPYSTFKDTLSLDELWVRVIP